MSFEKVPSDKAQATAMTSSSGWWIEHDGAPFPLTFAHALEADVQRPGDDGFRVLGPKEYSSADIVTWAGCVALRWRESGLGVGDRVVLLLPNGIEWIVAAAAASSIGATLVPLNIRFRPDEIGHALRSIRPKVVVLQDAFLSNPIADRLQKAMGLEHDGAGTRYEIVGRGRGWAEQFVEFDDCLASLNSDHKWGTWPWRLEVREDDLFICFWTSGTTGPPKGVVHTYQLLRNVWNWTSGMEYCREDTLITVRPYYYISGCCWSLFGAILHGARLGIASELTTPEIVRLVTDLKATILLGSPPIWYELANQPEEQRRRLSLTRGFFSGLPPREGFVEEMKEKLGVTMLVQPYGMTELQGFASCTSPLDSSETTEKTVGRELPGFEFRLCEIDSSDSTINIIDEPDRPGELWVRGRVLAGYLHDGDLEPAVDQDGWFRTGDMLSFRPDGNWVFHRRLADVGKIGGENVALPQVDLALEEMTGVRRAAVVVIEEGTPTAHLEAFVEAEEGGPSAEELLAACRQRMAPHRQPKRIWMIEDAALWPLTVSGKVQRRLLRESVRPRLAALNESVKEP